MVFFTVEKSSTRSITLSIQLGSSGYKSLAISNPNGPFLSLSFPWNRSSCYVPTLFPQNVHKIEFSLGKQLEESN